MGQIQKDEFLLTKVFSVEEDILTPKYGLKGKIDASVMVESSQPSKGFNGPAAKVARATPLEIKTGRAVAGVEHRAQTILYTILMAERYGHAFPSGADQPSPTGLLYYTHSENLIHVPANWNEVRGLIMTRNVLASFLALREVEQSQLMEDRPGSQNDAFLPATIDSERTCGRCYVSDTCMLYKKVGSFDYCIGQDV